MSTTSYAMRDAMTMLRRNLKHARRYPELTVSVVAMPILILLMFVYVFGGALGEGIAVAGAPGLADGDDYIDYIAPGIILMAATSGAIITAVSVCTDMTEGIINRFRTMAISRTSVLTGHVVGSMIQTMASLVLVVAVALLAGFRPNATPLEWLAAIGILVLLTYALTWLSAAMGLTAKTVETASNLPMPLQFLPLLGSSVVTPESMPTGVRLFAEYQPFTPVNETLRGLLMGTEIGLSWLVALGWGVGLGIAGYLWARAVFRREVTR
ncbi:ABC transporter permease [Streptomyces sp. B6B3]|uniref:ABC transporter permease n=1 Tax=Streptomyces sp. B6B3 TaxID=3153570 RepID=UPI00325D4F08